MNRRHFLALAGAAVSARLYAAPSTDARFLLVFLRGGYDAANLLVPVSSDLYYEARPNIPIARDAALLLDADWGLHPALKETVYPMFLRGELAFVPFAGSHDLSRSHFHSQDTIELGQPADARAYESGFMNRLAGALGASRAIAFANRLPLAFRGETAVANVAFGAIGAKPPAIDARQSALITEMYSGTPHGAQVSEGFAVRESVMKDLAAEMEASSRDAINARGFELQARRIARFLRTDYNLGFLDVGGWDTHVGEGGATGYLANRFEELGRGLAALADAMGSAWRDTVVVVLSEFGRTFRENGNRGTDHGHGSVYWVLGGLVRGAHIAGEQVRLSAGTLHHERDYPVLTDYRSLLGGLFARLYGVEAARIFPSSTPRDLSLL